MSNLADFAFGTMSMKRLKGKFRLSSTTSLPAAVTLVSLILFIFLLLCYLQSLLLTDTLKMRPLIIKGTNVIRKTQS